MTDNKLAQRFNDLLQDMTVPEQAKKVLKRLPDVIKELLHEATKPNATETGKELWSYDAAVVEKAYDLLIALSTEEWRQREAIKLYLDGRIDRGSLRSISNSWNGQP